MEFYVGNPTCRHSLSDTVGAGYLFCAAFTVALDRCGFSFIIWILDVIILQYFKGLARVTRLLFALHLYVMGRKYQWTSLHG